VEKDLAAARAEAEQAQRKLANDRSWPGAR
jgi:hypothetical protein